MKAVKGSKAPSSKSKPNSSGSSSCSSLPQKEAAKGKRGFRRHIQFRHSENNASSGASSIVSSSGGGIGGVEMGGGGEEGTVTSRAAALDTAQVALESFYNSFPVVPLLSVAHAKVCVSGGKEGKGGTGGGWL